VKSKEVDKKKNLTIYRYKNTGNGNDHFRNALNYFIIAANRIRVTRAEGYHKRQTKAINEYDCVRC
jgi:hypothetical protein